MIVEVRGYQPITIVLQEEDESDNLRSVLSFFIANHDKNGSDVDSFASKMYDDLLKLAETISG